MRVAFFAIGVSLALTAMSAAKIPPQVEYFPLSAGCCAPGHRARRVRIVRPARPRQNAEKAIIAKMRQGG